jgi:hypothetical protein
MTSVDMTGLSYARQCCTWLRPRTAMTDSISFDIKRLQNSPKLCLQDLCITGMQACLRLRYFVRNDEDNKDNTNCI